MGIIVTENRTTWDDADAVTNFNQGTANTTDFQESTGSVSLAINIGTDQLWSTGPGSTNLTDTLIYVWASNTATQGGWDSGANSPAHAIYISDGTNDIVFHMAGNDRIAFQHSDDATQFQCFLLDTDYADEWDAAGHTTALTGSFASLDFTAITEIGGHYITTSKALAGGFNAFVDISRYGNNGITVTGDGNFLDIAEFDRSRTDGYAIGIVREYTVNIYGVQGPITFGDDTGSIATLFSDTQVVIAFEDRPVADDKYRIDVVGDSTGSTSFTLTASTITSARPAVTLDFSSGEVNNVTLTNNSFINTRGKINFGNDIAAGSHTVENNTFQNAGQIDPGDVSFQFNNIVGTTADGYDDGYAAVLLDADGTSNWSDLSFTYGGNEIEHAIYITDTGTYGFTNITFSGYGASDTDTAAIFNQSGGLVTINVTGGDSPTFLDGYLDGYESTTVINVSVPIEINGLTEGSYGVMRGSGGLEDGVELLAGYANSSGIISGSFGGTTPQAVVVRARNSGLINAAIQEEDGVGFTDFTNDARDKTGVNDVDLLPATVSVNDAFYFGGLATFEQLEINVTTAGDTYVLTWEYWNGAWTALTVTDDTNSFQTAGWNFVDFTEPNDWAATSINSQGPFFYIRARVTTGGGTQPLGEEVSLNKTTKYLPFTVNGTIESVTGLTSTVVWIVDTNAN